MLLATWILGEALGLMFPGNIWDGFSKNNSYFDKATRGNTEKFAKDLVPFYRVGGVGRGHCVPHDWIRIFPSIAYCPSTPTHDSLV